VDYVKDMGYSHIELMPVMEHPFDGSWGYQPTGYYAPTSRYRRAQGIHALVDACHEAGHRRDPRLGAGRLLPPMPFGLAQLQRPQALREGGAPQLGHATSSTSAKARCRTFLISNALYWLDQYHADGLRMDGVSSMLYMNFGIDDPSRSASTRKGTKRTYDAIRVHQEDELHGRALPS
jgi:1,4-alpha-glucan branching enzyme